jgi:hypothetical protein
MRDDVSSKEIIKPDFRPGETETTMSILIADWLHEARASLAYPGARVSGMSDKDLRDIGLRPRSLTSTVYREIGKPGLVDFGWRLGR